MILNSNITIMCYAEIAISSQNCAWVWKDRDWKTVSCIKNIKPKARLLHVKPCKNSWNLSLMRKKVWGQITFYVKTTLFGKQEDWKTPCLMHYIDGWHWTGKVCSRLEKNHCNFCPIALCFWWTKNISLWGIWRHITVRIYIL